MRNCSDCGEQNLDFKDFCTKCGASLKRDNYSTSSLSSLSSQQTHSPTQLDNCQFSIVLFVMAWLSLFGGIISVFILWPHRWDISELISPLSVLASGIIKFALFYAAGKGLNYLHWILACLKDK